MEAVNKKIGDNMYKTAGSVPIAIGSGLNGNYDSYFGPDCIKDYVKDLLEIETENKIKLNKPMIFKKEDNLYQETNNTFHICGKVCINKVKDHCHETRKYRCPACNLLLYFIVVKFMTSM